MLRGYRTDLKTPKSLQWCQTIRPHSIIIFSVYTESKSLPPGGSRDFWVFHATFMNSYLLKTPSGKLHRCRCTERARTLLSARKLLCKTAQCCSFLVCVTQSVAHFGSCCSSCWCQKQLKNWHRRLQGRGGFWHCITSSVLSWPPAIRTLPCHCISLFTFEWH